MIFLQIVLILPILTVHISNGPLTLLHQPQRFIHISLLNNLTEPQPRHRLTQPDYPQQRPWRGVKIPFILMLQRLLVLAPLLHIVLHDDLLDVPWDHWLVLLGEGDVGTDEVGFVDDRLGLWCAHVLMDVADVLGHEFVLDFVGLVEEKEEEIETGEEGVGEVDVLVEGCGFVVAAVSWIGSCKNTGPSIQRRRYPCLRNTYRLLLHHLMYRGSIILLHLVKLVNTANAHIRHHQRTSFQRYLPSHRILQYSSSKTNS